MFLRNILSELSLKILLAEIILFSLILFGIGIYTNPADPLFIESKFGYLFYLVPILVLTLYYGLVAGIFMLSFILLFMFFYYKDINIAYILWMSLFTLVASEFNYYWSQNLKKAEERFKYTNDKLRDLARELMLLKISHDQLEKQYVLKPVSIRGLIQDFKEIFIQFKDENLLYKFLLFVATQVYNMESGAIVYYSFKKDKFDVLYSVDEDFKLNPNNILLRKAIEGNSITSVSQYEQDSEYLAVIPVKIQEDYYLFIIKKMDFLSLNTDTLLTLNLLMFYILNEKESILKIRDLILNYKEFSLEFLKEIYRMYELYKNFNLETSLVVFYVKTDDKDFPEFLRLNLRGLDLMDTITKTDEEYILPVLLPFTPYSGARSFVERINNQIKENYSIEFLEKRVRHKTYTVSKDVESLLKNVLNKEEKQ